MEGQSIESSERGPDEYFSMLKERTPEKEGLITDFFNLEGARLSSSGDQAAGAEALQNDILEKLHDMNEIEVARQLIDLRGIQEDRV